ncbi:MAG: hypothetical protein LBQ07_02425 [Endomicrobium sp.]|jgi:phosphoribosylformylglycinamidine (FGAM) synthase PurS component|nr:hypothetical protein [Endomicrobium sp.]
MFGIEIFTKEYFKNSFGERLLLDVYEFGFKDIKKIQRSTLYLMDGDLKYKDVLVISKKLLIDKVTEFHIIKQYSASKYKIMDFKILPPISSSSFSAIEVWYKNSVTDTLVESIGKAMKDLNIKKSINVKIGYKYYFYGTLLSPRTLNNIAIKLLVNKLIQEYNVIK